MNSQDFLRIVNTAFQPFLVALGFSLDAPSISGRFYRVSFSSAINTVSVSYEPGDNAFFIVVFSRENDELSDFDDRNKTPRLTDLNSSYMHQVSDNERSENALFFKPVLTENQEERFLLKCAKELRLVLPLYLSTQR